MSALTDHHHSNIVSLFYEFRPLGPNLHKLSKSYSLYFIISSKKLTFIEFKAQFDDLLSPSKICT